MRTWCISISSLFWVHWCGTALPVEDGGTGTAAWSLLGCCCSAEAVALPWGGASPASYLLPDGSPGAGRPSALPWGGVAGLGAAGGLKVPEGWQRGVSPAPFSSLGSLWGLVKSTMVAVTSRGRFPVPVRCQGRLRCPLWLRPPQVGTLSWGEALQNGRAGR